MKGIFTSYDEWVKNNICTGSASWSDMMKCSCDECYKLRRSLQKKTKIYHHYEKVRIYD